MGWIIVALGSTVRAVKSLKFSKRSLKRTLNNCFLLVSTFVKK